MRKKSIVILSAISLIVTLVVAILGYLVIQRKSLAKKEDLSTETGENEVYKVAIEESEESKLDSIKAKEMNKNQDGVTVQQGNIVVYMDTKLKLDPSVASFNPGVANYRTEYGIGETVVIKVYFDKEISSVSDETLLCLRFGTGNERAIKYAEKKGSELTFKYTIQRGDNGELKLENLSGTVNDVDGNSIRLGLSSDNVQYQDSRLIIANTSIAKREYDSYYMLDKNNRIHTEITYYQWVYIKEGDTLIKLTNENIEKHIGIVVGKYAPKGTIANCTVEYTESNETHISYYYDFADGDNGTFFSNVFCLTNIAGTYVEGEMGYNNAEEHNHLIYPGPEIITLNTPYAVSATVDLIDTNNATVGYSSQNRYLKAGKKIRIGILYNESVYKNDKTQLEKNVAYINITFKNRKTQATADKQAKLVEWNNDSKYLVYEYVIQDGDRNRRSK